MTDNMVITYKYGEQSIVFSKDTNFWLSDITGLGLEVDFKTTQNNFSPGEALYAQNVSGRYLSFTGEIIGDLRLNREKMLNLIAPMQNAVIVFEENGESWQIDVVPEKTPEIEPGAGIQSFQFTVFAPYPYFRTLEQKSYVLSGYTPMWKTPFTMSGPFYISMQNPNAYTVIKNIGNVNLSFVWEVYAINAIANPSLKNVNTGEEISIIKSMEKGDRFRISTFYKDKESGTSLVFITSDGAQENAFRYISPQSDLNMQIMPGDNIFLANAEENKHNLQSIIIASGGERHSL